MIGLSEVDFIITLSCKMIVHCETIYKTLFCINKLTYAEIMLQLLYVNTILQNYYAVHFEGVIQALDILLTLAPRKLGDRFILMYLLTMDLIRTLDILKWCK